MSSVLSPPTTLWCADRLVAGVDGPGLQRSYTFDRPYMVVGTSPRCDIVLPLLDGPPVALYLHATADAIHWLDLTSPQVQWRSGAFDKTGCLVWRGYHLALERVRGELEPRSGMAPLDVDNADARNADDRLDEAAVFDVTFDGDRLARAKLTHVMTLVGKSPRCRLRLRNRHVADVHCVYYVCGRRTWVIDLASRTGTFVGEEPVAVSEVLPGDTVRVGKPQMTMVRWSCRKTRDAKASPGADMDELDDIGSLSDVDMDIDDSASDESDAGKNALGDNVAANGAAAGEETIASPGPTNASLTDTIVGNPFATVVAPHEAAAAVVSDASAEKAALDDSPTPLGEAVAVDENTPDETKPPSGTSDCESVSCATAAVQAMRDTAAPEAQADSPAIPAEKLGQAALTEAPSLPTEAPQAQTVDVDAAQPPPEASPAMAVPPPVWPSPPAAARAASPPATADEAVFHPVLNQLIERHRDARRRRMLRFAAGVACGVAILGAAIVVLHVYGPL